MLKVVTPLNVIPQTQAKCGEIFLHSLTDFTIYCCFCQVKLFAFQDFLRHIQNEHFANGLLQKTQTINGVSETWTKVDNANVANSEEIQPKEELERFENHDNAMQDAGDIFEFNTKEEEKWASTESETSNDTDEDFEDTAGNSEQESSEESLLKVLHIKRERKAKEHNERQHEEIPKYGLPQYFSEEAEETVENSTPESEKPVIDNKFPCGECQQTFPRKMYLHQHVIEEHKGFKCSICDKRYRRQLELRKHLQTHNTDKTKIPCPISDCRRTFSDQKNLSRHLEVHTMDCTFVCDFDNCGKAFPTERRLKTHTYTHNKRNICDTCGYSCRSYATLVIHKRVHTGERPFPCEVCEKRFVSKTALSEHMIVHESTRSHVCQICQATFNNYKYLQRHSLIHSTDRNYKCMLCDKVFKTPKGLDSHMRFNHRMLYVNPERILGKVKKSAETEPEDMSIKGPEQDEGPKDENVSERLKKFNNELELTCKECKESFSSKEYLDKHVLELHNAQHQQLRVDFDSHNNEKRNIPCPRPECRRTFGTEKNLKRHLEVHNLASTFVCDFENCGKAFQTKPRLIIHSRTHNKHNICDVCGYRCRAYATLLVHKRVHSGERPFACELCEKRFISKTGLLEHMSVHASSRPHVCQICKASFTNYKSLRRHKLTHTTERNYKCKLCDKAFKTYNGLDNHMRCMHREPKSSNNQEDLSSKADNFEDFTVKKTKLTSSIRKDMKCKVCNKAFKRIAGLDNHMRRFHGETDSAIAESFENTHKKKFKCNLCNKKFSSLTRHNLTHTDDRKFECKLCDNIFKTYNGLSSHLRRVHGEADVRDINNVLGNAESGEDLSGGLN